MEALLDSPYLSCFRSSLRLNCRLYKVGGDEFWPSVGAANRRQLKDWLLLSLASRSPSVALTRML